MGYDNREMLLEAKEKHADDIDVANMLTEDGNEGEISGRIAELFGEYVSNSIGIMEDDGLDKKDTYICFGDDVPEDLKAELHKRIE